ncbi:hypothetical protein [Prosthecochloris sp. CIB 2401]|uniref:hypothetical protein n=1 Tax=Prosthecochloris sp. CIB 2401 TaxID=1868325 RepID=UPI00080ABF9A|nr:hypothetical protein [Prosthecochloris sp. CIB 2401]ANT63921.1 hypothetical protein Ptc2401_00106 [Prosthecochloris sp. CIB 2401]
MNNPHHSVVAEIRELEELLAAIPEQNVIDRLSLEARLQNARKLLERVSNSGEAPKARLTFRGRPVLGSHGISADFGAKAAGAFSDAFALVAAGLSEGLRHHGPIPDRDKNQLFITGTAIGSFGFEFELPVQSPELWPDQENAEEAMLKIETLFRLAAEGSDDDIAEIIDEIHPRAVKKVYEFLDLLVQQQAWCGLEFGEQSFRYADYDQIKASSVRLRDDNIQEREETYRGELQGVLPAGRTFEFKLLDQEGVIRGKVDATIEDPDILNREWLHKPISIKLNVMQVGQGQPRFTLMSLNHLIVAENE